MMITKLALLTIGLFYHDRRSLGCELLVGEQAVPVKLGQLP